MTKKEYILDFLKEINYAYNHPAMYDDLKRLLDEMEEEILESANEALEQQHCDDCISRKQAIELFVGWWSDLLEYHKEDECFDALLKALPPVTPQPKMGYWEWNQYDANPKIWNFHCSLCHNIGRAYYDYCPGCGAEMSEIPTGAEGSDNDD